MASNPLIPLGYRLMPQRAVTAAMTAWAVQLLHDAAGFPMFATATRVFDELFVLARAEWHQADFQNHALHRGVTLYEAVATDSAEGVDVSAYQAIVNWDQVAAARLGFAFIKATEATAHVDAHFAEHWAAAKRAGLMRGAYHFFRPQQDAAAQARHFLAQLPDGGELPAALDVELTDGVARANVVAGVRAWVEVVTPVLGRPLIYTSPGFWNSLPGTAAVAAKADLWVAHWNAARPAALAGWAHWHFWQFASVSSVPGVHGASDRDRFNGSLAELNAYSAAHIAALPAASGPKSLNQEMTPSPGLNP
ncbi:MAG: glycoside hydrolase family 25 protein [Polyangiaceae bacterium]